MVESSSKADRKAAKKGAVKKSKFGVKLVLITISVVLVALIVAGVMQAASRSETIAPIGRTISGRRSAKVSQQETVELGEDAKVAPKHIQAELDRAANFQRQRKTIKAEKIYLKIIEEAPGTATAAQAYANLGAVYVELHMKEVGDRLGKDGVPACPPKAYEYFEMAARTDPKLPSVEFNLGRCYTVDGKIREAIEHLRRAAALAPNNPNVFQDLARAYHTKKAYTNAFLNALRNLLLTSYKNHISFYTAHEALSFISLNRHGWPDLPLYDFEDTTRTQYENRTTFSSQDLSQKDFFAKRMKEIPFPTVIKGYKHKVFPKGVMTTILSECGGVEISPQSMKKRGNYFAGLKSTGQVLTLADYLERIQQDEADRKASGVEPWDERATGAFNLHSLPLIRVCPRLLSKMTVPKYFTHDMINFLEGRSMETRNVMQDLTSPRLFITPARNVTTSLHVEPLGLGFWAYQVKGSTKYTVLFPAVPPGQPDFYRSSFVPFEITAEEGDILYMPGSVPFHSAAGDETSVVIGTGHLARRHYDPLIKGQAETPAQEGLNPYPKIAKEMRAFLDHVKNIKSSDVDVSFNEWSKTARKIANEDWEV